MGSTASITAQQMALSSAERPQVAFSTGPLRSLSTLICRQKVLLPLTLLPGQLDLWELH